MVATVRVIDVVREMDVPDSDFTVYLNLKTGEFLIVSEDDLSALAHDPADVPDWQRDHLPMVREIVEEESADYISLPDSYDIHEWEIMRDFANSLSDGMASDRLSQALHGKGAFRYFRDTLDRFGLTESWYEFRQKALEGIAIDWLKVHGVPYTIGDDDEAQNSSEPSTVS